MKTIKHLSLLGIVFAIVLSSCSVQKRHYMSGLHVVWNNSKHKIDNQEMVKNNSPKKLKSDDEKVVETIVNTESSENAMVNDSEVDNTIASTDKSIFIPAAKKMTINQKTTTNIESKNNVASKLNVITKKQTKKATKKPTDNGGGKDQLVALLLCIFLGLLGVHRFYLGYTGMGVLYLLTAGIFAVGWIIDIVLLLIPDGLTPKDKTNYRE